MLSISFLAFYNVFFFWICDTTKEEEKKNKEKQICPY
jgi:hypothetical protein